MLGQMLCGALEQCSGSRRKADADRVRPALDRFAGTPEAGVRVVVIGDLMLDRYVYGDAERISPEAPVPVPTCAKKSRCWVASTNAAQPGGVGRANRVHRRRGNATMGGGSRNCLRVSGATPGVVVAQGWTTIRKTGFVAAAPSIAARRSRTRRADTPAAEANWCSVSPTRRAMPVRWCFPTTGKVS